MSLINTQVQAFKAQAFKNGKFIEVSDADLQGKWSVLIFMPAPEMPAQRAGTAGRDRDRHQRLARGAAHRP
jgi:hypothetical protein